MQRFWHGGSSSFFSLCFGMPNEYQWEEVVIESRMQTKEEEDEEARPRPREMIISPSSFDLISSYKMSASERMNNEGRDPLAGYCHAHWVDASLLENIKRAKRRRLSFTIVFLASFDVGHESRGKWIIMPAKATVHSFRRDFNDIFGINDAFFWNTFRDREKGHCERKKKYFERPSRLPYYAPFFFLFLESTHNTRSNPYNDDFSIPQ